MDHALYGPLMLVALGLALGLVWWCRRVTGAQHLARLSGQQAWRPRTPDDCAGCQARDAGTAVSAGAAMPVRPWAEVKSRRGAPKRRSTAGYACPSPACPYHGITDERVHALIGYGYHGATDRIQDLRCQACGTKVSVRRGTALYRLKTPPARVGEVLSALAEGLDVAAAVRVFGHGEGTVTRWLAQAGHHASQLHERLFRLLQLPHVQLDEIRTRLRGRRRILWLWLAVDPRTKIVPVLHLGPRTQQAAHAVIHTLRAALAPDCVPVVTSDGLRLYYYALTAHFGRWLDGGRRRRWQVNPALSYGQVQKCYRRRRLVRIRCRVPCGNAAALRAALRALGWSGRVNTAFVERLNLTVRQGVAALSRRTWATAQTADRMRLHLEWWRGYYHFVRPHRGLRVARRCTCPGAGRRPPRRYDPRTPAMAAGVTMRRWSTIEFLQFPGPPAAA
jgi:IS1 family transposase/transposase-like protein